MKYFFDNSAINFTKKAHLFVHIIFCLWANSVSSRLNNQCFGQLDEKLLKNVLLNSHGMYKYHLILIAPEVIMIVLE